jgi:spore germination cell wall hydrolase CwlJ-like protein
MTRKGILAVWRIIAYRPLRTSAGLLALLGCVVLSASRDAEAVVPIKEQIRCLALTIYFEARGEPKNGKLAVGHVVMNRVADPRFPDDVCDVVRQGGEEVLHRCQFSWWCDGLSDKPQHVAAWRETQAIARRVFWQYSDDPTSGAMWYHADYVSPEWRTMFAKGPRIGQHIFYRDRERHDDRPQIAQSQ